jgi:hypothetical protein
MTLPKFTCRKFSAWWRRQRELVRAYQLQLRCDISARRRSQTGVRARTGERELIISLTTKPSRLPKVHLAIETLLQQSYPPQRVILWLADTLAPADLPTSLRRQQQRGLEVRFRRDLRAHTKLIHALREHPDSVIVTADDDTFYPRDWLEQLHQSYLRQPNCIHCHRAHWIRSTPSGALRPYLEWEFFSPDQLGPSLQLFPTGVGGVLYPPGALPTETLNETVFQKICLTNDDIWFKAMSLLAGVPTMKVAPVFAEYPTIPATQRETLKSINWGENANDRQLQAVFAHYDLLPITKLQPCF